MNLVKKKLEKKYKTPDPWGYKTNPDDIIRKELILRSLFHYDGFECALDIGCGEGWITAELPARIICGYDISENAMSRLPDNIVKVDKSELETNKMKFDLIIATGVLYKHYDYEWMISTINRLATGIVLTCNIFESEIPDVEDSFKNQILGFDFPYRKMIERLRIFDYRIKQ